MRGTIYGVGVGPGDPELITLKAVRLIRDNPVIAFPGKRSSDSLAYQIAASAIPEIAQKKLVPIEMPMVQDPARLAAAHQSGARILKSYSDQEMNVVYLTLGDPSIYCSFSYLKRILNADGYPTEVVSGVPSFCAAAARLNMSLVEGNEDLHIMSGVNLSFEKINLSGNYVFMKPGKSLPLIWEFIQNSEIAGGMVENCGMDTERCYLKLDDIPQTTGYFSIVVAKT